MTPFSVALVASCPLVAHPCVGVFAFIGIFGLSAVLYPPWLAARAGYYARTTPVVLILGLFWMRICPPWLVSMVKRSFNLRLAVQSIRLTLPIVSLMKLLHIISIPICQFAQPPVYCQSPLFPTCVRLMA